MHCTSGWSLQTRHDIGDTIFGDTIFFSEMKGSGLIPGAMTYNILIKAYCREGNSQEVFVCLYLKLLHISS